MYGTDAPLPAAPPGLFVVQLAEAGIWQEKGVLNETNITPDRAFDLSIAVQSIVVSTTNMTKIASKINSLA